MISVLVVEDEEITAEANRIYVERVPGFEVAGVARSGAQALRFLRARPVDLILLDLYLPDMHGLDVCRALRAGGLMCDVIAVTSARDLAMVRSAVSLGVSQYLLKPFTFATLAEKLTRYARFKEEAGLAVGQGDVDRVLGTLRGPSELPKGMARDTLDAVAARLRERPEGMGAQAVADAIGVSRVTARRYLEYLVELGVAARMPQYGGVGRPELLYRIPMEC
ncbi:putative two-component system response regulator [[Actinomadura] parvosata subsp. kistnae]|uniref:Transcriptional regulatory protein n=1 Tax=[Actinomadura] parvosata subsp. kistnae TaxID=1909395 RepID=A0A1V0A2P8_9ACTN|nr:response regulator [Nonomuraea sp. ATCC 55076]AQZ64484.1 two-component system response regulator [Nonomuraea sp. ATCC 55076]SPL89295.1 putative two-component system response regulator [Actinomadura parvosata subsp. kistnae]